VDDTRTHAALDRLEMRSIETLERLARIEAEMQQVQRDRLELARVQGETIARVAVLEASEYERRGEVRQAQAIGASGGVLGLAALARLAWDHLVSWRS